MSDTSKTQYSEVSSSPSKRLPNDVTIAVVVATLDRPGDLRACLRCLLAQNTPRRFEIVVVDNNPDSGLTADVVSGFPGVTILRERRRGLAYARNTGISCSYCDIIITVDDDVTMPPEWLENLVSPFAQSEVMAVTGNVLPLRMETTSELLFEAYGGLGRGLNSFEVGRNWFESFRYSAVPTWELGAGANAAFRSLIFRNPVIGLFDEALGAGMPSGCSEDTYLFYKILRAGYKIVYEPRAYVWHKHRRDLRDLRKQIYDYSKGHVAYHLTTLFRDHDPRALSRLLVGLPKAHISRIKKRLLGETVYPLWLIVVESIGNLIGPFALWRSRQRVSHEGRNNRYASNFPHSTPVISQQMVEIGSIDDALFPTHDP